MKPKNQTMKHETRNMKQKNCYRLHVTCYMKGQVLLEILIALGLVAVIATLAMMLLQIGQRGTKEAGTKARAFELAAEAQEVVRDIANCSWHEVCNNSYEECQVTSTAVYHPEPSPYMAFVSSGVYNGNFFYYGGPFPKDSIANADNKCQVLADAAGLGNAPWKAWLASSSLNDPESRFTKFDKPIYRTDGVPIANNWSDLTDGILLNPLNKKENGGNIIGTDHAWTAVNPDGTANTFNNCNGWGGPGAGTAGYYGLPMITGSSWSIGTDSDFCSATNHIYCFSQAPVGCGWRLVLGPETKTLSNLDYTRSVVINNVCRDDASGTIVACGTPNSSDDPSTRKVTVTVSMPRAENVVLESYITRWGKEEAGQTNPQNCIAFQTDWSSGTSTSMVTTTPPCTNNFDLKSAFQEGWYQENTSTPLTTSTQTNIWGFNFWDMIGSLLGEPQ